METQNDNYQWRPNDNSSSTRLKYDLEAEHMVRAYKSAYRNQQTVSIGESISIVGMVLTLVASLVILVVLGIVDFIKWIWS